MTHSPNPAWPRSMARTGGLYGVGVYVLLAGAFMPVADFFIVNVAPTIDALVAARLVQGATAAMLVPQALATFQATLEGERKTRAIALYGATSGIAAVVGQLAGGLLVSANLFGTSWRPILLVNIPLGIIVFFASRFVVPANRSPHPTGIDLPGTVLFAATLTTLLVPLTEGHSASGVVS
ncbi:MFS transporter [Mesorhizobium newzealandense]|uniref:MFS transporter n=1 Tax=Mesorhizobium newzealandense TaxID=1300302 RepID=A0ABW4UFJ4_9HYPH